uniref:Uncharacterized protein n=1 Tax=uncultured Desulfobacterium sp. TaxID=201089 RepID=E1Y9K9_9BACT|nr:unknown protein [uncultured Desulfobacterium sp.]
MAKEFEPDLQSDFINIENLHVILSSAIGDSLFLRSLK